MAAEATGSCRAFQAGATWPKVGLQVLLPELRGGGWPRGEEGALGRLDRRDREVRVVWDFSLREDPQDPQEGWGGRQREGS